jgi:methyl-accepting chemotaxis protein
VSTKSSLKLSHRLMIAFSVLALLVAAAGGYGIFTVNNVSRNVEALLASRVAQTRTVMSLEINQKASRVNLLEAAMVPADPDLYEDYANAYHRKLQAFNQQMAQLEKGDAKLKIPPAVAGSPFATQLAVVGEKWQAYQSVGTAILAHKQQLLAQGTVGARDHQLDLLATEQLQEVAEDLKISIEKLNAEIVTLMKSAESEIETTRTQASLMFSIVILAAVIVAFGFGYVTTRSISQRIQPLTEAFRNRTGGDLTARVPVEATDELGNMAADFNAMADQLAGMVRKVGDSTMALGTVAENLSDSARQVNDSGRRQVQEVATVTAEMSVLGASIAEVGDGVDGLALVAAETSSSIMEMAASIDEVALNTDTLATSVEQVSSSVVEMAASVKQISSSAEKLMESSVVTASSVTELNASIKVIESNAVDAARVSQTVRSSAEQGRVAADDAVAGMKDIRRSADEATESIERLLKSTEAIDSILAVIDEITEQTNLLALNAAIIAAQAGEHGKGFAVVADEIRELAERTGSSTREIGEVIQTVQNETQQAVGAIRRAESTIALGETQTLKVSTVLLETIDGVGDTSRRLDEIAQSTVLQSKESQQINRAMEQIADMVGQIARATSEQSKGGEQVMSAVEQMRALTGQVRISTREQTNVSRFITRSTENITELINQIKIACGRQKASCKQITGSVNGVDQAAQENLATVKVMDDAMASLLAQIKVLQREMGEFKV